MRIAILGGGFTGLSAAHYLQKKGHSVTIFEKEEYLGGLAAGFKSKEWNWYLERTYHHWFSNDFEVLKFAKETGFSDVVFKAPVTASLFSNEAKQAKEYEILRMDSPKDLLKFPHLSFSDRIKTGLVIAFLKISPFLKLYERESAESFLRKTTGDKAWFVLWDELFRKKFGKYAGNVLMSFFWARVKKRTRILGYPKGGFQTFINRIEKALVQKGVAIKNKVEISGVIRRNKGFVIKTKNKEYSFDAVVCTLPTPVLSRIARNLLPHSHVSRFLKIQYLHAVNLIIESKEPFLKNEYWLNITTKEIPIMVLVQHTNLVSKENYGGKHILYVGNYVDSGDPLMKADDDEIKKHYLNHLKKINPTFDMQNSKFYIFKCAYAQPIFDREFLENKPDFQTPIGNFFIANLDMTYPFDRGTNYAVALGQKVTSLF